MEETKSMQTKHKVVVAVTILICLAMFLFPPMTVSARGTIKNMGYSFIFNPQVGFDPEFVMVNVGLLFAQWIATWFISSLILLFLNNDIRKFVTRERLGIAMIGIFVVYGVLHWLGIVSYP